MLGGLMKTLLMPLFLLVLTISSINNGMCACLAVVPLQNGAVVPLSVAERTMKTINRLKNSAEPLDIMLFIELMKKAQNKNHILWANLAGQAQTLRLLNADGTMDDVVRAIILSAVQERGMEINLIDPVSRQSSR